MFLERLPCARLHLNAWCSLTHLNFATVQWERSIIMSHLDRRNLTHRNTLFCCLAAATKRASRWSQGSHSGLPFIHTINNGVFRGPEQEKKNLTTVCNTFLKKVCFEFPKPTCLWSMFLCQIWAAGNRMGRGVSDCLGLSSVIREWSHSHPHTEL